MKATLTLISRAALVAGVLVAVSAQSVSAHGVNSDTSHGHRCWAHSHHKAHSHSVGHDHDSCDHSEDDDNDNDDATTPSTSIPTGSGGGSTPGTGSSESTPTDRSTDSVVTSPTSVPPSASTVPVGRGDEAASAPEESTTGRPASPTQIGDTAEDSDPAGVELGTDIEYMDGEPGSRSESSGDLAGGFTDAENRLAVDVRSGGFGSDNLRTFWWVLVLLAAGVDAIRRARKAREFARDEVWVG